MPLSPAPLCFPLRLAIITGSPTTMPRPVATKTSIKPCRRMPLLPRLWNSSWPTNVCFDSCGGKRDGWVVGFLHAQWEGPVRTKNAFVYYIAIDTLDYKAIMGFDRGFCYCWHMLCCVVCLAAWNCTCLDGHHVHDTEQQLSINVLCWHHDLHPGLAFLGWWRPSIAHLALHPSTRASTFAELQQHSVQHMMLWSGHCTRQMWIHFLYTA